MSIVDHIAFRVYDLEKAKRWYEKNLDAKMTHRDEFYIRMSLENTTIALIDANRYPYDHIGILVDDANDLPKESSIEIEKSEYISEIPLVM